MSWMANVDVVVKMSRTATTGRCRRVNDLGCSWGSDRSTLLSRGCSRFCVRRGGGSGALLGGIGSGVASSSAGIGGIGLLGRGGIGSCRCVAGSLPLHAGWRSCGGRILVLLALFLGVARRRGRRSALLAVHLLEGTGGHLVSALGGLGLLGRGRWGDDGYRPGHRRCCWCRGSDGDGSREGARLGSQGVQGLLTLGALSGHADVGPHGRCWARYLSLLLLLLLLRCHQPR